MQSQFPKDREFLLSFLEHLDPKPLISNFFSRGLQNKHERGLSYKRQITCIRTVQNSNWKRWVHDYLACLKNVASGDTKRMNHQNYKTLNNNWSSPWNSWLLRRVTTIHLCQNGEIRVVYVKIARETMKAYDKNQTFILLGKMLQTLLCILKWAYSKWTFFLFLFVIILLLSLLI